jgi:hypothetical protein
MVTATSTTDELTVGDFEAFTDCPLLLELIFGDTWARGSSEKCVDTCICKNEESVKILPHMGHSYS